MNANITWKKSVDACVNPIAVTTDEPGSAQPPTYKFRTGTFLVIIDSIDCELQKRLVAHTGIAKRFGFLQKLKNLPDDQVVTSTRSLQEPYTTGLEASLSDELLQPSSFLNMEPAKKSLDECDCLSSYTKCEPLEEAHTLFHEALENISTYLNRFQNGLKCTILVHKRRDKY